MKQRKDDIYDTHDTTAFIDPSNPLTLANLGLKLPKDRPTTVVSIRLPTALLRRIKASASEQDIPYYALIKSALNEKFGAF